MRALCGAIIVAGSLIGLGLLSIGIGSRYSGWPYINSETGQVQFVYLRHLDTSLMVILVALLISLAIGLGVAFLGLAYHHHRRHQELMHQHQAGLPRTGPDRPTSERVTTV
jgi:hypothetical protein